MKENFDCTFIPPDPSEPSKRSSRTSTLTVYVLVQERILFMTMIRLDLVIKMYLFWKMYFHPQSAPAALLWFSNFKMPVSAFQIELFLPQSGTQNPGRTVFSYIQVYTSFVDCLLFQQQNKVFYDDRVIVNHFKILEKCFIGTVLHACTYTTEDVWTLITGGWWHHKTNTPHCFLRPHNHQRSLVFLWKLQGSSVELLEIILPTGRVVLIWLNSCFIQGVRTLMSGRTAKTLT